MALYSPTDRLIVLVARLVSFGAGPSGSRIFGQAMMSATNLSIALLVVWEYGAAVFGVYSFFALIALFLTNVLTAAFVEPAAPLVANMEKVERRSYFSALALSFTILAAILIVPFYFSLGLVASVFLKSANVDAVLIIAFVITLVCAGLLRAFLQAFAHGFLLLGSDSLRSALCIGALLVGILETNIRLQYDPYYSVIALQMIALMTYLAVGALFVVLKRWVAWPDFAYLTAHRASSGLTTAIAILQFLQTSVPLLFAQFLLGEQVFGQIRAYQTIANFVALPRNALRLSGISGGADAFASGGTQSLFRYVFDFFASLALTTLAGGVAVLVVLALLPDKLRPDPEGFLYISLFLACAVLGAINVSLSTYFYANSQLVPLLIRSLAGTAIAIVLTPVLILYIGGAGAPVSLLVVLLCVSAVTLFFLLKKIATDNSKNEGI